MEVDLHAYRAKLKLVIPGAGGMIIDLVRKQNLTNTIDKVPTRLLQLALLGRLL